MASAVYSEPPASRLSISLEGEASASPFPSPSSSFLPPPMPGAHEFAVKPAPPARNVRKSNTIHPPPTSITSTTTPPTNDESASHTESKSTRLSANPQSPHPNGPSQPPNMSPGASPREPEATNGESASYAEPKSARSSVSQQTLHPNGISQPPNTMSKESLSPGPSSPLLTSPTTPTPYSFQHQPHLAPMEHLEPPISPVVDQSTSSSTTPTILTSSLPPEDGIPTTPDAKTSMPKKESPPPSKIIIPDTLLDVVVTSGVISASVPSSPAFSTFSSSSRRSGPMSAAINADPSLFSNRPAPPSPAMSRRVSGAPSLATSTRSRPSRPPSTAVSRTNSLRKSTASGRSAKGSPVINPHRQSVGSQLSQSFAPLPSPQNLTFSLGVPFSSSTTSPTTPSMSGSPSIHVSSSSPQQQKRVSAASASLLASTSSIPMIPNNAPPVQQTVVIKIRDFGFPASDERHVGLGPDVPKPNKVGRMNRRLGGRTLSSSSIGSVESSDGDGEDLEYDDDDDGGINGWGNGGFGGGAGAGGTGGLGGGGWDGFMMGRFNWNAAGAGKANGGASTTTTIAEQTDGAFPSRRDLDRNFLEGDDDENLDDDDDGEDYFDADGLETPADDVDEEEYFEEEDALYPGLYRALYAFEPEGTAEMRLEEDQIVRVVGRGGGVGWAVVVDEKAAAAAVVGGEEAGSMRHALVPESYLEPVRLDWEDEEAAAAEGVAAMVA